MDENYREQAPDSRLKRWANRVIDGERVWGSLEIGPDRRGFRSYRLVVYPPGIDPVERRYLRLARSWPVLGAALWLMSLIFLGGIFALWVILTVATVMYLGGVLVVNALAGQTRSRVQTLSVVRIAGYDDALAAAKYAELELLANRLLRADTMRASGEISVPEHETVWWSVYDHLVDGDLRSRTGADRR